MSEKFTITDLIKKINKNQITNYEELKTYYTQIKVVSNKDKLVETLIDKNRIDLYGPYLRDVHTNQIRNSSKNAIFQDTVVKNIKSVFHEDFLIKIAITNPTLEGIDPRILPYFIPIQNVYSSHESLYTILFRSFRSTLIKRINNPNLLPIIKDVDIQNNLFRFLQKYITCENYFIDQSNYIITSISSDYPKYEELVDFFIEHMSKKNLPIKDHSVIYFSIFSSQDINKHLYLYSKILPNIIFKYTINEPFIKDDTIQNIFLINPKAINLSILKDVAQENKRYNNRYGFDSDSDSEDEDDLMDYIEDMDIGRLDSINHTFNGELLYILLIAKFINKLMELKQSNSNSKIIHDILLKIKDRIHRQSKFVQIFQSIKETDTIDTIKEALHKDYRQTGQNELNSVCLDKVFEYWIREFINQKKTIDTYFNTYGYNEIPSSQHMYETYQTQMEPILNKLGESIYRELIIQNDKTLIQNSLTKYKKELNNPDPINHLTPLAYAIIFQNVEAVKALITTSAVFQNQSTVGKRRIYYDKILNCISVQELAYMTKNNEIISLIDEKLNLMNRWKNYSIDETIQKMKIYIIQLKKEITEFGITTQNVKEFEMKKRLVKDLETIYMGKPLSILKTQLINLNNNYYHQTNPNVALSIINTLSNEYWFLAGSKGMYGAGIYFAKTPEETNIKALSKGTTLEATVLLGKPYMIHNQDEWKEFHNKYKDLNADVIHHVLKLKGFDSVIAVRETPITHSSFMKTGNEYIVYNTEQVIDVKSHDLNIQNLRIHGGNKHNLINTLISTPVWLNQILKNQPLDINSLNSRWLLETTPLMIACAQGNLRMVQELIDKVPLEDVDAFGRHALFYAIQGGNERIVQLLMDKGIDIFKRDSYGKFSVEYFSVKKHFKFTENDIITMDTNMSYRNIVFNKLEERFKIIYNKPRAASLSDLKPTFIQPYTYRRGVSESKQMLPKLVDVKPVAKRIRSISTQSDINNLILSDRQQLRSSDDKNKPIKKLIKKSSSQTIYDPNNND